MIYGSEKVVVNLALRWQCDLGHAWKNNRSGRQCSRGIVFFIGTPEYTRQEGVYHRIGGTIYTRVHMSYCHRLCFSGGNPGKTVRKTHVVPVDMCGD